MDFENVGEFFQAVATAADGPTHPSLIWSAATGAGEVVPSDGGYVVPPGHAADLLERAYSTGEILRRVSKLPMASNKLSIPLIDESTRADGSRFGALAMNWTDEAVEIVASRPKFAARELTTKKLAGLCYVTDELLQDSPALGIVLERLIALEAGFRIEDSIINGTGAGRPLGILNANALITVAAESGQAGSTVQAANIINMWSRLWVGAKPNAVWLVNTDIFPQLLGMTWSAGTATVPLFAWSADGVPLLLGRPVVETEHSAVLGTVGDIILCDLGEIMLGERTGGLRTDLSLHVRFANHENAFRFIWRTDAQPKWSSATTPKNGSSTVSPYIALATRP